MDEPVYDFIVVGAGSAGCVLADRLTADGANTVLLLEAGGDDRIWRNPAQALTNLQISVPGAVAEVLRDPRVVWPYAAQPDVAGGGRSYIWPRGRVLGGSSSINGMIYSRGQHADYDMWRQMGCAGWGWDDVLPYFRRAEDYRPGADIWRGCGGRLAITRVQATMPVSRAAIEAFVEAGVPRTDDVNGAKQEGVEEAQITAAKGKRSSTSAAYLRPALGRANLRVETHALVRRVLLSAGRAQGVEYEQGGQVLSARARREVILCGGVVNSPQLLELSGIGDGRRLAELGIPVAVDLPEVGENLQDHYNVQMQFRLKPGVRSLNALKRAPVRLAALARYLLTGGGVLAEGPSHATAFAKTRPDLAEPDVRFLVMPLTMALVERPGGKLEIELEDEPGLSITTCQLRPQSRGSIHLRSPDPRQAPRIIASYLSAPEDRKAIVEALKLGQRVTAQPALAPFIERRLAPAPDLQSDEELLAFAARMGGSGFHPVGACRMGGDLESVVDPALRVRRVDGLRVVDASIMPRIVSGNTNGPTVMIAEKAADLLLGRTAASPAAFIPT